LCKIAHTCDTVRSSASQCYVGYRRERLRRR